MCIYIYIYKYVHKHIYHMYHICLYLDKCIFCAASRGSATAQVGVFGLVRSPVGVLVSARSDKARERTVFVQGGRWIRAPEYVRSHKTVWRSSRYNFRNASNSILQKLYQLSFSEVLTIILSKMLAALSIYAKGWRKQCKIESETATAHGTKKENWPTRMPEPKPSYDLFLCFLVTTYLWVLP